MPLQRRVRSVNDPREPPFRSECAQTHQRDTTENISRPGIAAYGFNRTTKTESPRSARVKTRKSCPARSLVRCFVHSRTYTAARYQEMQNCVNLFRDCDIRHSSLILTPPERETTSRNSPWGIRNDYRAPGGGFDPAIASSARRPAIAGWQFASRARAAR
jgi:hypothetical protein